MTQSVLLLTWRLRWAYLPFYCTEGDSASVIKPGYDAPKRLMLVYCSITIQRVSPGRNLADGSVIKIVSTDQTTIHSLNVRHLKAVKELRY